MKQKELEVLNEYLTDSPVSVLQKEFVETEDALCTDVDFHITDHLKSTLMFTASSVPIEEIENFPTEFFDVLQKLVDNNDIDMTRMATVIEKEGLKVSHIYTLLWCGINGWKSFLIVQKLMLMILLQLLLFLTFCMVHLTAKT